MIVVIGSINFDLITEVERLPRPGETIVGKAFRTAPGGKGANQALAAARAGGSVRMVGAVGSDAFAGEALALLKSSGTDLDMVRAVSEPTGTALILVDAGGENIIAVTAAANGQLHPRDVASARLGEGDILVLQNEVSLETVEAALVAAAKVGAISILNAAPFLPEAAGLLAQASIVVANETEFDLYGDTLELPGATRPERMQAFVALTGRTLIVTLGGEGALAQSSDGAISVPTIAIKPVDTVGAGDTFCGALAAGLDTGLSLEQAMRRAAVAGALACLKAGAQPSVPTKEEIDQAMPAR